VSVLNSLFFGPGAASYGLATLVFAAFAVHLSVGWKGGAKATLLLGTVIASALWAALSLGFAITAVPVFWVTHALGDALRMGGWLLFVTMLLLPPARWRWSALVVLLVVAASFLLRPISLELCLALAVGGLVLTEQVFRRAKEHARWAIKPLCIGLGGSFIFDLYFFADALLFRRFDLDLWAARGLAQTLVIPFIAVATARNKEWTIDIAVSRGIVFHSTAVMVSGLYLLAVAAAGYYVRYFGGSWGKTVQIGFVFAALLLLGWLFSSGALRARLRVFINKNFFSFRYDYRQEWLRFTNLLSAGDRAVSPDQRSIEALANLVESPGGVLWMRDDEGNALVPAGRWNVADTGQRIDTSASLPVFLKRTGWIVKLPEYRKHPERYAELSLPPWLESSPWAWLIVPINAQDELIGVVVLAAPRTPIDVNWEVLDLLKTAARQVGSFLGQIRATRALLEARQFEAFSKMTAFVVHDLKSLVAQLALLLKNAERHGHNPRFQEDMLSTVRNVAERMTKLLLQLSSGNSREESLRPLNLASLAQRVVQAKAGERAGIPVEGPSDLYTLGHESRLERVIGHLVQNAIEATRESGEVRLRLSVEPQAAVVEVIDTGCGMSEEFLRERLFRPFQTTKAAGMGIGAFETAQYVKEIGGTIEADSRPGAGTRIKVILPLHQDHAIPAAQARQAA
jgi:putative PEP-CTERM system histidine kinase